MLKHFGSHHEMFSMVCKTSHAIVKFSKYFFWRNLETTKSLPMIVWDKICLPKFAGRLGLYKAKAVNKAFTSKLTNFLMACSSG